MSVETCVFVQASISKEDLHAWRRSYSMEALLPGPVDGMILVLLLSPLWPGGLAGCGSPVGEGLLESRMKEVRSRRGCVKQDRDSQCSMGGDQPIEGERGSAGRPRVTVGGSSNIGHETVEMSTADSGGSA